MAENTSNPPTSTGPQQEPMWQRFIRELRQEISQVNRNKEDADFDDEANALAVGVIVLGVLILGFFLVRSLLREEPSAPAYAQLEAIKRVEHLVLVRQHYETLIPVAKDGDSEKKLRFLLRAPIEIDGYLDMDQVEFQLHSDSLVEVFMPPASVDTPYLDLQNTGVYAPGQSFLQRMGEAMQGKDDLYVDAYDQIRLAMQEARSHVRKRAYQNGILSQTQKEGQRYLRNLINSLGYRARFHTPIQLPPGTNDSTRTELLLQEIQKLEGRLPKASETDQLYFRRLLSRFIR